MRLLLLACPLLLAGCMSAAVPPADQAAPPFPVMRFFAGEEVGTATLHVAFHRPEPIRVLSRGRIAPDGVLVLDQTVEQAGKPPRRRTWHIHQVAPGRYAGTLSDAAGPVSGEVTGNRLHLAFAMKGGVSAQQWLTLAPDGRSAANVLLARKFGIVVARLDETIRKSG